ncbi:hypothetical protein EV06_0543 [Prochlorococcus sp. MIT 0602]|nr:hypothetical protein EV06_0543 [Prochlorococcus sp. MIT 0602]KGG18327.1 hypothetical protein EV07_0243 [Prochlorococcus sp. MIT 0603]
MQFLGSACQKVINDVKGVIKNLEVFMSQTKREQVVSHLRYVRQELREMHQGVLDDGLLPEPGEIRGVMAQMEALYELLEGKSKSKTKIESA